MTLCKAETESDVGELDNLAVETFLQSVWDVGTNLKRKLIDWISIN